MYGSVEANTNKITIARYDFICESSDGTFDCIVKRDFSSIRLLKHGTLAVNEEDNGVFVGVH